MYSQALVFVRPPIALLALLLPMLVVGNVRAQFVVDVSSPVTGAVDVPLTDTIAFAFSEEVDISLDWNVAFVNEPRDSIRISRLAVCLNFEGSCGGGTDVPRFVRYTVRHRPETDYTWLVYAARSADNEAMSTPYVLRYTTASTIGERTVDGSLRTAPAKRGAVTAAQLATLKRLAAFVSRRNSDTSIDRGPTSENRPDGTAEPGAQPLLSAAAPAGPYSIVWLVDSFTSEESEWNIRAGTVTESDSYRVEYVRSGTYWPLMVRYRDASHEEIEALGFYDPDRDGSPDSVTVDETNLKDVDLAVFDFPLTTAQTYLTRAREMAAAYASDQDLIMLASAGGARPSGRAYAWTYTFYSPGADRLTTVRIDPLEATVDTSAAPLHVDAMRPIRDDVHADSDAALQAAAGDGGDEFWAGVPLRNLATTIEGGHFYWLDSPDPDRIVWRINVAVVTSSETRLFERYVDFHSGAVLHTSTEDRPGHSPGLIAPAYPNPFSDVVTIPFSLERSARVTVDVHDMLGRRVATLLHDQWHPSGEHDIRWAHPDVPAGVYVYRLRAGEYAATGRLIRASR